MQSNEIISYMDMCLKEGTSLQRGMNFKIRGERSVFLMSTRPNAPYDDEVSDEGKTLIYEGHDENRTPLTPEPKRLDQPEMNGNGRLTANGKFHRAAQGYQNGGPCELVYVYEKIKAGLWTYNGCFQLIDSKTVHDGNRNVFKFLLKVTNDEEEIRERQGIDADVELKRIIPSSIKQQVWKRDKGKCTECGATDDLHFDHIIPYSKGGSSRVLENVQLLCARHNLRKTDKII